MVFFLILIETLRKFIYLFLLLTLIGCNESKNNKNVININNKKITYYLNKVSNDSLSLINKSSYNKKAFKLLSKNNNTLNNRKKLKEVVTNFYILNDWENYLKSSKLLYNKSVNSNDSLNMIISSRCIGNYFYNNKILDSAYFYYLKSMKISIKTSDNINYGLVLLKISSIQYEINDFVSSDLTSQKAYIIIKNSDENQKKYIVLTQLGLIATELKSYDKGIEYHKEALFNVLKYKLETTFHEKSVCYNNIGYLYLKKSDYNQAIQYFNLGLDDLNLKNDDPDLYSNLIDNLSYSNLKLKKFNNVPELFQTALEIRDRLKNTRGIISSYTHLSEYYEAINDTTYSIIYSKRALKLAKESKNPFDVVYSLKQAASADKKNASIYIKDYIRIGDSLQDEERKNKDRFARIQLETDELIKENTFLSENNKKIIYFITILISIISLLFIAREQRNKAKLLLLEQAQQKANEEIYRMIISEQDKVEQGKNSEKKRISQELHDGILGRMFGLRLNLDGLNTRNDDGVIQDRDNYLNELKLIEQDIREISHELSREKKELINNFISLVNALLENQKRISKTVLEVMIDNTIDWNRLSNSTRINLYRILQECLQNVNKYAKAKKIIISFKKDTIGNLILSIFDNGIGFDAASKTKGIGLSNIINRAQENGGTIDINSSKNKGTSITIIVPLDKLN